MSQSNDAQIAEWNGMRGQRWVDFQPQLDRMIDAFGAAALQCAAAKAGERVLDIGCGCGSSSLALAQAVGPQRVVLGVDISRPMLAVALRRGAAARCRCWPARPGLRSSRPRWPPSRRRRHPMPRRAARSAWPARPGWCRP
jgi:SAM-dependent methyltransferase